MAVLSTNDSSYRTFFQFVGSDNWGNKLAAVKGYEKYARGSITILPDQQPNEGARPPVVSLVLL